MSENGIIAPFKVFWIRSCTTGILNRDFLTPFWREILGTEPLVETFTLTEEDILFIGASPFSTALIINSSAPRTEHIELWIDDLNKAREWLTTRGIPFTNNSQMDSLTIDPGYLGENLDENIEVILKQAPDWVTEACMMEMLGGADFESPGWLLEWTENVAPFGRRGGRQRLRLQAETEAEAMEAAKGFARNISTERNIPLRNFALIQNIPLGE